jgi:hypothetical protein
MLVVELFYDKSIKPKEKTKQLANLLLMCQLSIADLILFAHLAKDPVKASCIEGIEFATQYKPELIAGPDLDWIIDQLSAKAPRIQWEAAKVIANTISLYPDKVEKTILKLVKNTDCDGTVVRWSAATALARILTMKTAINTTLIPAVQTIVALEGKNSIKKIYLAALKKVTR